MSEKSLGGYIRAECANCRDSNGCHGMPIYDSIQKKMLAVAPQKGNCVVIDSMKQPIDKRVGCTFFEKCLLPLSKQGRYVKACQEYKDICMGAQPKTKVRYCGCGSPLAKGMRLCDKCRRKSALLTQRTQYRKNRQKAGSQPL